LQKIEEKMKPNNDGRSKVEEVARQVCGMGGVVFLKSFCNVIKSGASTPRQGSILAAI
jgi:hypothetical protein